ncbi:hypothetical protein APU02_02135 [Citrobacter sp. 50677481]|nr:hypothetical protein APU02_02135 [Citrobacter sp. 50677481]
MSSLLRDVIVLIHQLLMHRKQFCFARRIMRCLYGKVQLNFVFRPESDINNNIKNALTASNKKNHKNKQLQYKQL